MWLYLGNGASDPLHVSGVKIVCSYTLIVQLKFQNVQLNPTICAVNVSHEKNLKQDILNNRLVFSFSMMPNESCFNFIVIAQPGRVGLGVYYCVR